MFAFSAIPDGARSKNDRRQTSGFYPFFVNIDKYDLSLISTTSYLSISYDLNIAKYKIINNTSNYTILNTTDYKTIYKTNSYVILNTKI